MELIKETIKSLIRDWESKAKNPLSTNPEFLLTKILAKRALSHVKLDNFINGVLRIKVDSSTWLYYLSLQKLVLLAKLRKISNAVKDIHFSLGA